LDNGAFVNGALVRLFREDTGAFDDCVEETGADEFIIGRFPIGLVSKNLKLKTQKHKNTKHKTVFQGNAGKPLAHKNTKIQNRNTKTQKHKKF
jgi:hypothetical protein